MDKLDREVIDGLSEPAKRLFFSLDHNSQRRMLKQAKELATLKTKKGKQKGKAIQKSVRKSETKKKAGRGKDKNDNRGNGISHTSIIREGMIVTMHSLLLGASASDDSYQSGDTSSSTVNQASYVPKHVARSSSSRLIGATRRRLAGQIARKKMAQRNVTQASQKSAKAAIKGAQKTAKEVSKVIMNGLKAIATNPLVWIALLVVLVLAVIVGAISMVVSSGGAANSIDSSTYQAQVSEKTEAYRDLVEKYCEQYAIDDYVDLCLAMIEQESGGNPPDVMQTTQSYYNTKPPIDTAEESIDCGTHELSDCLTKAECKSANDIQGISLALQGYNFGNGYIDWALENYKGYSKVNAELFSQKMCSELGYSSYGDVEYVPHVLRYYVANPETSISNESAKSILGELKDNNEASDEVWAVIEKGASLIGNVTYSMEQRQGDGRDNPQYLDCSAFTAWAFHKAGITSVAYSSTTATFIASGKYVDIEAKDLRPGDIGLKSSTAATGGANHVGIYCGQMKNGTKVWLHCTSSSGTSLTGNDSGVMFGAYTNFTYFRRLKKWNK